VPTACCPWRKIHSTRECRRSQCMPQIPPKGSEWQGYSTRWPASELTCNLHLAAPNRGCVHSCPTSCPSPFACACDPSHLNECLWLAGFCAVSKHLPLPRGATSTTLSIPAIEGNGLNANVGFTVHCLSAEPHATFLRIGVSDFGNEVANESCVLGRLTPWLSRDSARHADSNSPLAPRPTPPTRSHHESGGRLRNTYGTRIELCCLFTRITVTSEANFWSTPRQVTLRA
jgi:hypothetical protein